MYDSDEIAEFLVFSSKTALMLLMNDDSSWVPSANAYGIFHSLLLRRWYGPPFFNDSNSSCDLHQIVNTTFEIRTHFRSMKFQYEHEHAFPCG